MGRVGAVIIAVVVLLLNTAEAQSTGPQIVLLSDDMRVVIGDTTVLLCMTFEQTGQDITWTHNGENLTNTSLVTVTGSDFSQDGVVFRQSFLRICNTSRSSAGLYTCIASNSENSSTQITAVTGNEAVELVAISNSTTVSQGETALLVCLVYGEPFSEITWTLNGETIENSSFVFTSDEDYMEESLLLRRSTLQICDARIRNSGDYTCFVNNGLDSVNASTQLIIAGAENVSVAMISNSTAVSFGETALLICIGYAIPMIEVSWMLDGRTITNSTAVTISESDATLSGALFRQSVLKICSVGPTQSGTYTCAVTNTQVDIDAPIEVSVFGAYVAAISDVTRLTEGEAAILTCVGYGTPYVELTWRFNDEVVINSTQFTVTSTEYYLEDEEMLMVSTLQICDAGLNFGEYTCTASAGQVSNSATTQLILSDVELVAISNSSVAIEGQTSLLSCIGWGQPTVVISWERNNQTITNSVAFSIFERSIAQEGRLFMQSILQICGAQMVDSGTYTCIVSNNETTVTSSAELIVSDFEFVELVALSDSTTVSQGETALLTCLGYGEPYANITWTYNGETVISSSLISILEEEFTIEEGLVFRQSSLQICNAKIRNSGDYTCIVSNSLNSVSASTQLNIAGAENVSVSMISNDTAVLFGETALLTCVGYAIPMIEVSWMLDGGIITNSTAVTITEADIVFSETLFRQSVLKICSVGPTQSGTYTCAVTNTQVDIDAPIEVSVSGAYVAAISDVTRLTEGEAAILTCVGYGTPYVELTWRYNNEIVMNSTQITVTAAEYYLEDREMLMVSTLQICDAGVNFGEYTCTASVGSISNSATTQLILTDVELVAISNSSMAIEGQTALLLCIGWGQPTVMISWERENQTITNSVMLSIFEVDIVQENRLFKQSVLQICGAQTVDTGAYTCVVSNNETTVNSSIELVVSDFEFVELVALSDSTTVSQGETALLTCLGYGEPYANITWIYNGETVISSSLVSILEEEFIVEESLVFRQSSLQICNAKIRNSGDYTCIVSNTLNSVSASTQLNIRGSENVSVAAISNDTAVSLGGTVLLTCLGYAIPLIQMTWLHNGRMVANSTTVTITEADVMFSEVLLRQSSLRICSAGPIESGTYTCAVTNTQVDIDAYTEVTVSGVYVAAISDTTRIREGEAALLTCVGYGTPYVELAWRFNDEIMTNSFQYTITSEEVLLEDGEMLMVSILQICDAATWNSGEYTCVASVGQLSESATTQLILSDVEVVAISNTSVLTQGQTSLLSCIGWGRPSVEITWALNDETVALNSSLISVSEEGIAQGGRLFKQSVLTICSTEVANAGTYTCIVSNNDTSTNSSTELTVFGLVSLEMPRLLMFSRSSGDSIMLLCRAQGLPLPEISWFKDDSLIVPSGSKFQINSGTNLNSDGDPTVSSVLTVTELSPRDAGDYNCRAVNSISSASLDMPYVLTVSPPAANNFCSQSPCQNNGQCTSTSRSFVCECTDGYTGLTCDTAASTPSIPVLTQAPQNSLVPLFGRANFSCVTSGSPQPRIQWFKDGQPLPGETSAMLVINDAILSDRGFYHCVATNSEGEVVSPRAALNLQGIYQYRIPIRIPVMTTGPSTIGQSPSRDVLLKVSSIVSDLSDVVVGTSVGMDPEFVMYDVNAVGNVTTVSSTDTMGVFAVGILVTLFDPDAGTVQPSSSVLSEIAELMNRLARDQLQIQNLNVQAGMIERFDGCDMGEETLVVADAERGTIHWGAGTLGITSLSRCPCDLVEVPRHATRMCGGDFLTGAVWMESNKTACEFDSLSFQLCGATSMSEVASLSSETDRMKTVSIVIIALVLEQNASYAFGNVAASDLLLNMVDNILKVSLEDVKKSHTEFNSTSRIWKQLDQLMSNYPISETPEQVIRDMFGCALYPSLDDNTAQSFSPSLGDSIELIAASTPNLTLTLPETLAEDAGISTQSSLTFCSYKSEALFVRRESYLLNSGRDSLQLSSGIVSANPSVMEEVNGLSENVIITFVKNMASVQTVCSYWDQSLDDSYGGWSEEGCQLTRETEDNIYCECDRLGTFAILTDTSIEEETSIQVFTILGVGVALICVLMVLVSIIISSKLRSSSHGVTVMNLCVSLLFLYIIYTIAHFAGGSEGGCAFVSFLFHYFVLVCSLSLAITAFFTAWSPSSTHTEWTPCSSRQHILCYLTAIILNWVVPLVVVIVCIAVGLENYAPSNSAHFCRPVSETYWYGLLLVAGFFMVLTIVFLIIAPICAKSGLMKEKLTQSNRWYTDYFGLIIISIFFYAGWGFGIPATHPLNLGFTRVVFQVIFIVCNILQGLIMVLCYCQKLWRAYIFPGADNAGAGDTNDDGLLFENPLADGVTDDTLPDYDAVFEQDEPEVYDLTQKEDLTKID